jgi:hypothetical protein
LGKKLEKAGRKELLLLNTIIYPLPTENNFKIQTTAFTFLPKNAQQNCNGTSKIKSDRFFIYRIRQNKSKTKIDLN